MDKQKLIKAWNVVDISVVTLIILVTGIFVYSQFVYKKPVAQHQISVTVRVPSENIEIEANKKLPVYLDGVDEKVSVTEVKKVDSNLEITLLGSGERVGSEYIFNGQRIVINQKAEIHGTYFAQGRVISISDEVK